VFAIGDRAGSTVAHGAGGLGVSLAVLSVCTGDDLAGELLHSGVPSVFAPSRPVTAHAAATCVAALYDALGLPLAHAVARARAAVRALAEPHPDARWYTFQLSVSRTDAASVAFPPTLPGWEA